MNRREALRLVSLGALGLVACSAPDRQVASPSNKTTTTSESKASSTPKLTPEKTPNPIEQQVKDFALLSWQALLTTPRKGNDYVPTNLAISIQNPEIWNTNRFLQIARTGTHPTDIPLKVRWIATKIYSPTTADKWIGEVEINNVKIKLQGQLATTDAEKANGIEWNGAVELDFISHSRSYLESGGGSGDQFKKWLESPTPSQDYLPFSAWIPDAWGRLITTQNGAIIQTANFQQSGYMKGLELPTIFLGDICDHGDYPYCKRVLVK